MGRHTLPSRTAKRMNAKRQTFAGGRPRGTSARCTCGVMTLKRALARGKSSEHEPGCEFSRN
jgi:hypothetical protein